MTEQTETRLAGAAAPMGFSTVLEIIWMVISGNQKIQERTMDKA